jgi:hypothetical protein
MELSHTHEFASKIRRLTTTPVHQAADSYNFCTKTFDDIDCLLNFRAPGNDIFRYDESLAGQYSKSTSQNQLPVLFLGENVTLTEGSADFLSDNDAAHSRRDNGIAFYVPKFCCQVAADFRGDIGVLQDHGTLEILPAVQTGTENEMAMQQCTRFLEHF